MLDREYYIVKIPNPNSQIKHALDVSIGDNEDQRYSLDGSLVIIKTTPQRIAEKEAKGVPFDTIFPPALTTKVSYQVAFDLRRTIEWKNKLT